MAENRLHLSPRFASVTASNRPPPGARMPVCTCCYRPIVVYYKPPHDEFSSSARWLQSSGTREGQREQNGRMKELTLVVAGVSGCIGTTIAAGSAALQRDAEPFGLLSESPWPPGSGLASLAERLDLAPLSSMRVMGWDLDTRPVADSAREKGIVPPELFRSVAPELQQLIPLPAISRPRAGALRGASEHLQMLRARGHDPVLIDVLPAFETPVTSAIHHDPDLFERALLADDPAITPSMLYAWLALSNRIPYLNFTSNVSAELPALRE